MYINHITLSTGHTRRSPRGEVADDTLALLYPWLAAAIAAGEPIPLPANELAHFSAAATVDGGALLVTVFAPAGPHIAGQPSKAAPTPLLTLGIAQRSRQGADLWAMMQANFGGKIGLQKPAEPWCAIALHPAIAAYPETLHWIGDLERCIAWAWITRRPDLRSEK